MARYVKNSSQGLLLLSLVLLAFSVISARINGQSIESRKSKMAIGANNAIIHDQFNGCYQNHAPPNDAAIFCCNKDKLCWPSLPECVPNCPCKVDCGEERTDREAKRSSIRM